VQTHAQMFYIRKGQIIKYSMLLSVHGLTDEVFVLGITTI
jgi:hypothetical protein